MRSRYRISLAGALLLVAAQGLRADATSDARKEIEGKYRMMMSALEKKDLNTFSKYCTPDCLFIDKRNPKGIALKEWKATGSQVLNAMKSVKTGLQINGFTLRGPMAIVDSTQTVTMVGISPEDKKTHTFRSVQKVKDTWRKTSGGWLLASSNTLSQKDTMDGKSG